MLNISTANDSTFTVGLVGQSQHYDGNARKLGRNMEGGGGSCHAAC